MRTRRPDLDLVPDLGGHERGVGAFVSGAAVDDAAFVVGVGQEPVDMELSGQTGWRCARFVDSDQFVGLGVGQKGLSRPK